MLRAMARSEQKYSKSSSAASKKAKNWALESTLPSPWVNSSRGRNLVRSSPPSLARPPLTMPHVVHAPLKPHIPALIQTLLFLLDTTELEVLNNVLGAVVERFGEEVVSCGIVSSLCGRLVGFFRLLQSALPLTIRVVRNVHPLHKRSHCFQWRNRRRSRR